MNPESKRRDGRGVYHVLGVKVAERPGLMTPSHGCTRGRAGPRSGKDPGSRAGLLGAFPKPAWWNTQNTAEYHTGAKRSGILMAAATWMDLGNMQSEISQTQKDKSYGNLLC